MVTIMNCTGRSVAQPGSAHPWGGWGRKFKSSRSDHFSFLFPIQTNLKSENCDGRKEETEQETGLTAEYAESTEEEERKGGDVEGREFNTKALRHKGKIGKTIFSRQGAKNARKRKNTQKNRKFQSRLLPSPCLSLFSPRPAKQHGL